nr:helix-turn-helix transcriptional regulator [Ndongobacter massiliensis]
MDTKTKCIEAGITQARLAKEIETSVSYVNRVIRSKETIVNNTLVKMMEALGYDIKLRYVRREEELWHKANIISITY